MIDAWNPKMMSGQESYTKKELEQLYELLEGALDYEEYCEQNNLNPEDENE